MIVLSESSKVVCPDCDGDGHNWQDVDYSSACQWLECRSCEGGSILYGHRWPMGVIAGGITLGIYLIEDFGHWGKLRIIENTLRARIGVRCLRSQDSDKDIPADCTWSPWVHLTTTSEEEFERDIWLTIQNYQLDQKALADSGLELKAIS